MDEKPTRRAGPGRPQHEPTDKQRQTVLLLAGFGATTRQIGRQMGLSKDTIEKHYRDELEEAWGLADLQLYGALWKKAVVDRNPACLIFLAKNRLGMSDQQTIDHKGELPPARAELCLRVTYVMPTSPRALAPPPAHLLPPEDFQRVEE